MNRVASRAAIAVLLALLLVAGLGFFVAEYVMNAADWVMFSGSPHIYSGGNIGCGTVVDAAGTVLLDMNGGRTYASSESLRKATVHWLGDRSGSINAPALPSYAAELAGYDLVNGVYAYGNTSGTAKLTIDGNVQTAALEALGDKKGTVAVYNYETGAILCAVTTPNFDPDNVPDLENDESGRYEGMYVNRFLQSAYIPGSIFKIVTLATALEELPEAQDQTFYCSGELELTGNKITCERAHGEQSLMEAFRNSCNCAFAQITQQLGEEKLQAFVEKTGLLDSIRFDGFETRSGNFDLENASAQQLAWSGIGQHRDLVNPCGFLAFLGAIAGEGRGALPYSVAQVSSGDKVTYTAQTRMGSTVISPETARTLREYMGLNVTEKYGAEHFPGLTVCAKSGTGEVGGGKEPNAMFAGFVADERYPLAFFVAVEEGGFGAQTCIPILSRVLEACKLGIG